MVTPAQRKANAEHIEARIRQAIRSKRTDRPFMAYGPLLAKHLGLIDKRQFNRLEKIITGEIP